MIKRPAKAQITISPYMWNAAVLAFTQACNELGVSAVAREYPLLVAMLAAFRAGDITFDLTTLARKKDETLVAYHHRLGGRKVQG